MLSFLIKYEIYLFSEFLINHLDHVSDALVLVCLHEPLPEVPLDGYMELFLLVRGEPRLFYLRLDFGEALYAHLKNLDVVTGAENKIGLV